MVVDAGSCAWLDLEEAAPNSRINAKGRPDRGETMGARRLGCRRVELVAAYNFDCVLQNSINLGHGFSIDTPSEYVGDRGKLLGAPCPPQRDVPLTAIEHPAHCHVDDASVEAFPRELVELLDSVEILLKPWRPE